MVSLVNVKHFLVPFSVDIKGYVYYVVIMRQDNWKITLKITLFSVFDM